MTENPNRILTEEEIRAQCSKISPYFDIRYDKSRGITQRDMNILDEMAREFLNKRLYGKEPWE